MSPEPSLAKRAKAFRMLSAVSLGTPRRSLFASFVQVTFFFTPLLEICFGEAQLFQKFFVRDRRSACLTAAWIGIPCSLFVRREWFIVDRSVHKNKFDRISQRAKNLSGGSDVAIGDAIQEKMQFVAINIGLHVGRSLSLSIPRDLKKYN